MTVKERSALLKSEIEEEFSGLKKLPQQILHPFDLLEHQFIKIRSEFPQFKQMLAEEKQRGRIKGIAVERLKELL